MPMKKTNKLSFAQIKRAMKNLPQTAFGMSVPQLRKLARQIARTHSVTVCYNMPMKLSASGWKIVCMWIACWLITQTCCYENLSAGAYKETLLTTWEKGRLEVIVPAHTWHNRAHYSKRQIDDWNEDPWGLGLAKTYVNEHGNRQRLLALTFQDSHNKPEPTFGYSWQAVWRADRTFRPTLGFVAGFTMRDELYYIPVPAAIPIVGLDIGPLSLEASYIFFADIAFAWVTWRF